MNKLAYLPPTSYPTCHQQASLPATNMLAYLHQQASLPAINKLAYQPTTS